MSRSDAAWEFLAACTIGLVMLGVGPLVYLIATRWTFGRGSHSPDQQLSEEQTARYRIYPHAAALQLAANRAHNSAITAKMRYHVLGIIASSVAPGLVLIAAFGQLLARVPHVSEEALRLLELMLILGLAALVFGNYRPTDTYHRLRLRAELLRAHLHMYLAGVGPYRDSQGADQLATLPQRVETMDKPALLAELRHLSDQCLLQSSDPDPRDGQPITLEMVKVYVLERVGEQSTYFVTQEAGQERSYGRSTRVIGGALIAATVAALARLWWPDAQLWRIVLVLASAAGVLTLALRAVFGWDSRAELYYRQERLLARLADDLEAIRQRSTGVGHITPPDVAAFRRAAAAFESLMAREACDWALITDRRYYDASV